MSESNFESGLNPEDVDFVKRAVADFNAELNDRKEQSSSSGEPPPRLKRSRPMRSDRRVGFVTSAMG